MNDRKSIAEQMRCLNDPPVGPYPAQPLPAPPAQPSEWRMPVGHWRSDLSSRPNAWRRFWTWALLGWRWHQYPK